VLWHLAWVLGRRGDATTAGMHRREALAIGAKHGAYGIWPLLRGVYDLTDLFELQGKFSEAEPLLLEAAAHLRGDLAGGETLEHDIIQHLVAFYEIWDKAAPNTGKNVEAVNWRKKQDELNERAGQKRLKPLLP
jgi:hypothetical protein